MNEYDYVESRSEGYSVILQENPKGYELTIRNLTKDEGEKMYIPLHEIHDLQHVINEMIYLKRNQPVVTS